MPSSPSMSRLLVRIAIVLVVWLSPALLLAQLEQRQPSPSSMSSGESRSRSPGTAQVRGRVTDKSGRPLQGVTLFVDQRHGTASDAEGQFTIGDLTPGSYTLRARYIGYASDSISVQVEENKIEPVAVTLAPASTSLGVVRVEAGRLNGQALSLNRQRVAENLVSVSSSQEIEALPNANAADAFSRLPGVSLQRHEGEGAAVQIRGMDGNLSNTTINGAHMSGKSEDNTGGDRRVYLDGVPAALLGAVQLNKTVTPDMDADAIGGTAAIETKSADAAPGFHFSGSYGRSDLMAASQRLVALTYGHRFNNKTALFVGYSTDNNARVYDDVEPTYARIKLPTGDSATIPAGTSAREYYTDRTRSGATARLDWSPADNTTLAISGIFSRFADYGTRYRQDHLLTATTVTPANAFTGTGTGMQATSNVQRRTPLDLTGMLGGKGTTFFGANTLDYSTTYSMDVYQRIDGRDLTFAQKKLNGSYDWTNPNYPEISPTGTYSDPTQFAFKSLKTDDEFSLGQDFAAALNFTMPGVTGDYSSAWKFGAKFRGERKEYNDAILNFNLNPGQVYTLATVLGKYSNPAHYWGHYPIAFSPDDHPAEQYLINNPGVLSVDPTTSLASALAQFSGSEKIASEYVAYTIDIDRAHLLFGLRAEQTSTSYNANATVPGTLTTNPVTGGLNYTDIFPNAQLKYALDDRTNLRLAVTTSMGRPLYSQIAPSVTLTSGAQPTDPNAISTGNPNLKAMTSVNEDIMLEHFLPGVGLIDLGLFAKQISNYIYSAAFVYSGAPYDGYHGTRPENTNKGTLEGAEAAWMQRFEFLPGLLSGIGIDANGTYTQSNTSTPTRSSFDLPRQSKWNGNLAATYGLGPVAARITYQYNGPYIYKLGDGTPSPTTGDTYMMPHTQVDASLNLEMSNRSQFVLQVLNLNNAPFGFYTGTSRTFIQKEFYGVTTTAAIRFTY
jgi:TonB-dependent receptor